MTHEQLKLPQQHNISLPLTTYTMEEQPSHIDVEEIADVDVLDHVDQYAALNVLATEPGKRSNNMDEERLEGMYQSFTNIVLSL